MIFRRNGFIPKDHSERVRILEREFSQYYTLIDKYFPLYQSSYKLSLGKEVCDEIKGVVQGFAKEQRI